MKDMNLTQIVTQLLEKYPQLRKNDSMLVAGVHYLESGAKEDQTMSAFDVLTMLFKSQLSKPDSILRIKRGVMRKRPELL